MLLSFHDRTPSALTAGPSSSIEVSFNRQIFPMKSVLGEIIMVNQLEKAEAPE
jgi:hypothetical protein